MVCPVEDFHGLHESLFLDGLLNLLERSRTYAKSEHYEVAVRLLVADLLSHLHKKQRILLGRRTAYEKDETLFDNPDDAFCLG